MADYFTSHVLGQRGRFDKEYKIIRKNDGAERWVHGLGELEFDERNQPVRMVGTIQDITERKQAETALRESLLFRREAEKIARIGAWKANPKTDHLYWTEGVYEIVEAPPEYKPGLEEGMKFYTAATIPVLREALHRALEHGTPFVVDVGLTTMTGRHIWTEVRGLGRITEDEGAFVIGTIQDVTERMRVESAMREREEKFRNLFNNAEVGMFRSRLDGSELLDLNDKYLAMLGLTREEAVGKPAGIIWADPEERKEMVKTLQANGRVNNLECRMKKKDGSVINCIVSARLYPEQGIVEGSVIDITARKRAEAEKERLEEQLQQAQKMESVGRLAGGVAHDFNNMLGVILGHADLALEQMAAEHPVHADLAEIRKAAGRSADLTRQLLAFARKQTIAPKVLDLNETVEGMLNMLRRLIGEDIQLNWHPGAELWPAKVDSSQIDQILTNLCVNARDAISGVGQITIETGNATFDAAYCTDHAELVPGDYVRLSVSDSGCGMDRETLSHLFEPFFTTKGVGRGTGLGLATVYGAVKQNNGFISTCSEPGQGTMITIHLPRHAEKSGQAQNESPVQPDVRGRETILLAEDEPSILKLTTTMLEKLGYTVLAASTPGEAIRLAREHTGNVHLLITDVVMPEMNGRDLAKNVLSIYPDIRRLFMSGYTADVIAHHGVLDEGVYFIQKPFALKELAAKVRETLDAG
jgi:PAS domain S-box-containing protein